MEHFTAQLDKVAVHVVAQGSGNPVVLLHGFPEFWYSWRSQIPALAEARFRALAVDLRGYNDSEKPRGIRQYALNLLVDDIVQLIDRYASGRAHVVGHDWGGVIAWRLAAMRPDLVEKLVILNAPHPSAFRRLLGSSPMQWLRSSYVLAFQIPWLAERLIRANDFRVLEQALRKQPVNRHAFSDADIQRYKEALGKPGALTAALNYYRAALRYPWQAFNAPRVTVPTLVIWGEQDLYLSRRLLNHLNRWVADVRTERLANASHWVQNDAPAEVNKLMLAFLRRQ